MKATDLLKEHHQEVEELFERMSQADNDEISALRDELVATLVSHSAIEEELFYPESREALGASPLIPTSYEEHALVDVMLQKLLSAEPGDETFHARLDVLKELVQHHVEEEEKELFPQVESAMGAERLEELGSRLAMRFGQVRESDVEALLARNVAKSMPAAGRRARAAKPQARKAAAKRPPAKRAPKRASTQRAEPARGAQKGRRTAATGRKKAAATPPTKTGRAAPARKASRPAKTSRTGRKGGRASSASAR
ncbi:hemerythrin domain-containing protein [Sorangium atrum]|uniref:Hemerythrin domain-containing protein n=1 Tax=Sorangium atrum TaxID=2995308 RepID=A0ABT5CBH8_9BACT|nr:hemerythrin domain-containing protein [Sorangium aterium]MDC0683786.1 hemerythrin domain-containing protein [Sorangium aterium]